MVNPSSPLPVAIVQHPMWLIIKEDTLCAERTPPWGAASIEDYSERIDRNLRYLEEHPSAKVNYDFSAAELADVDAMYPDLGRRIREAVQRKQLGIVNGTYSQPHLHTLSLEASVRQFQEGTRIIQRLFGYTVQTYLMQEPGYTDQTPQILAALGFRYAHPGCFITRLEADFKEFGTGKEPFLAWRGLDGTELTAMTWSAGVAIPGMPDMTESNLDPNNEYVLLDEFLPKREAQVPGRKKHARMWIPWSYLEGTDGEQLSMLNSECEAALVRADTATALFASSGKASGRTDDLWRTWMLCQHHDAYWSGGPELRAKCCNWLRETIRKADEITRQAVVEQGPGGSGPLRDLVMFSPYPREHRGVVAVNYKGPVPAGFVDGAGKKIPTQAISNERDGGTLLVPYHFDGAGTTQLSADRAPAVPVAAEPVTLPIAFENPFYKLTVDADGCIRGLKTAAGHASIPDGTREAVLSATIDGRACEFVPEKNKVSVRRGPVATVIDSVGRVGNIPVTRRLLCYPDLPWFEIIAKCEFDQSVIGDFYEDSTKLCLRWRLENSYEWNADNLHTLGMFDHLHIVHGIGGGAAIPPEPRRAFFPVNWFDRHSGAGGLALINFGTFKHVWKDHELLVVLAWGGNTTHFGNRVDNNFGDIFKGQDLRPSGRRIYRFAVYPHDGDWRQARVSDLAAALLNPPLVIPCSIPAGTPPFQQSLLKLEGNVIPTSIFTGNNKKPMIRVHEPYGDEPQWEVTLRGKSVKTSLWNVADKPNSPRPWGIFNLRIE